MKLEGLDAAQQLYTFIIQCSDKQKEVAVGAGLRNAHVTRPRSIHERDLPLIMALAIMVLNTAEKALDAHLAHKQVILDKLVDGLIAAYGIGQQRGSGKMAKKLGNKDEMRKHIIPVSKEIMPYEGRLEEWENLRREIMDKYADETKKPTSNSNARYATIRS